MARIRYHTDYQRIKQTLQLGVASDALDNKGDVVYVYADFKLALDRYNTAMQEQTLICRGR